MAFSLSILPVISVFLESKYFCASSTPSTGFEAASTRLTISLVKESKSVRMVLASASFLQPANGRQAKQISRARNVVRIKGKPPQVGFEALSSNRPSHVKSRKWATGVRVPTLVGLSSIERTQLKLVL